MKGQGNTYNTIQGFVGEIKLIYKKTETTFNSALISERSRRAMVVLGEKRQLYKLKAVFDYAQAVCRRRIFEKEKLIMKKIKLLITLLSFSFALNAQLKTYDYYRELKAVGEDAYYQLKIGSSVLDRSGSYRVYEITAKDTSEVPYIAGEKFYDTYDKSYFKSLNVIDKSYENGKASYATLVIDTNLIYNTLYLSFNSSNFFAAMASLRL